MMSNERNISNLGFRTAGEVFIPHIAAEIPEAHTDEPTPSQNDSKLEAFLIYAVSSPSENASLSFAKHLRKLVGKTAVKRFAKDVNVDYTTLSRLLNSADRTPSLPTVARTVEGVNLSDAQAYQIIMDSATVSMPIGVLRRVFSDNAPVLEGSIGEQLKGYRLARNLTQRILADRANVDHASISRFESEDRVPAFVTFANIAYVLGLNAGQVRGVLRAVTTGSDPSLAA